MIGAYSSQHQSANILLQYTAGLLLKINLCLEEVLETIKGKVTIMKTMTFIVTLSLPVCVHSIVWIVPHTVLLLYALCCTLYFPSATLTQPKFQTGGLYVHILGYCTMQTYRSEIAVLDYAFSLSTFDLYTMLKA